MTFQKRSILGYYMRFASLSFLEENSLVFLCASYAGNVNNIFALQQFRRVKRRCFQRNMIFPHDELIKKSFQKLLLKALLLKPVLH